MTDQLSLLHERVDALQRRVDRVLAMLTIVMLMNSTALLVLTWR